MAATFSFHHGSLHLHDRPLTDSEVEKLASLLESADAETLARLHLRPQWLVVATTSGSAPSTLPH
jgi:hypothetical protein